MDLFFHSEQFQRLYACNFDIDAVPVSERQHIASAATLMFFFVVYEVLYIPAMFVMGKYIRQSSYKFMFFIGVNDIACLWINGFITGFLAIEGDVYCSRPTFIYLSGLLGNVFWYAGTSTVVLLAISRCIETMSKPWGRMLFHGNRTWLWLLFPTAYGVCLGLFTKPFLFSGVYFTWFFNPYAGYLEDTNLVYINLFYIVHNSAIAVLLTASYAVFAILMLLKNRGIKTVGKASMQQRLAFLQVLLISAVNGVTCVVFVYMQYVNLSPIILILGQFFWMSAHGLPGLIYVVMNKTVRKEIRQIFVPGSRRVGATTYVTRNEVSRMGGGRSLSNIK